MSWFSILPESISFIETWAIRIFLVLGTLTIGPWLIFLVYDLLLYVFRTITYDLPYIGGRARNRPRPIAPTLSERPSGRPRSFSLTVSGIPTTVEAVEDKVEGLRRRLDPTDHNKMGSDTTVHD